MLVNNPRVIFREEPLIGARGSQEAIQHHTGGGLEFRLLAHLGKQHAPSAAVALTLSSLERPLQVHQNSQTPPSVPLSGHISSRVIVSSCCIDRHSDGSHVPSIHLVHWDTQLTAATQRHQESVVSSSRALQLALHAFDFDLLTFILCHQWTEYKQQMLGNTWIIPSDELWFVDLVYLPKGVPLDARVGRKVIWKIVCAFIFSK